MDVEDVGDGGGRGRPHSWHCISGVNNWVNSGPFTEVGKSGERQIVCAVKTKRLVLRLFRFEMPVNHPNGDFQGELVVKDWCMENRS